MPLKTNNLPVLPDDHHVEKVFIGSRKELKSLPEYKMLNARKYRTPKGYASYDEVAYILASYCLSIRKMGYWLEQDNVFTEKIVWPLSQYFAQYNPPVFWLQKDLLQALLETDIPELEQIQQVTLFGTIMLPLGMLKSPDQEDITHICFTHIKAGHSLPKINIPGTNHRVQLNCSYFTGKDNIIITTSTTEGTVYVRNTTPQRIVNGLQETWNPSMVYLFKPDKLNPQDIEQAFIDQLEKILVQCLLIMQARPELIDKPPAPDRSRAPRGSGNTKKQPDPQLLSPIWIGRHYRSPQPTPTHTPGTHASPRMHWRRGYWRHQAIGPREEKQYKLRWIEPTLVNAVVQE